jgi:hypothetical protein
MLHLIVVCVVFGLFFNWLNSKKLGLLKTWGLALVFGVICGLLGIEF